MPFGLFGKLPQKRDFLSVGLPHAVLNPFETWLQSGVAASRSEIGRNWEDYYLIAPIWRFWLGKEVLGVAATGSLMPSVDQVGRYFPLAIIYCAGPDEKLVPPLIHPNDEWYQRIEQRLLSVLAENVEVDVGQLLVGLEAPDYSRPVLRRAPPRPMPMAAPVPEVVSAPVAPPPAPEPVEDPEPEAPPAAPSAPEPLAVLSQPANDVASEAEAETAAAPAETLPAPESEPLAPEGSAETEADTKADEAAEAPALDWAPVPMAADKVAELNKISAASFAPAALGPTGSLWDFDPAPAPAETAPPSLPPIGDPAPRAGQASAFAWDDPVAPASPAPVEEAVAPPPPPAPPAAAETPFAAEEPPLSAEVEQKWAPAPEPPPVRITSGEFKGGFVSSVEDGATFSDALVQLLELEHANAAATRGYWWCGASSQGGPRFHSRQGLPDPYFFTRMLMWNRP